MQKVESLHFIIQGEFLTSLIRGKLLQQNLTEAYEIISEIKPIPTNEQIKKIFSGHATFTGYSICDNKLCNQCKGKSDITLIDKVDHEYIKELESHKKLLKEIFIEIDGDVAIEKNVIADIILCTSTLQRIKEIRKNETFSNNMTLKRKQTEASDELERAEEMMYRKFYVEKDVDYVIGSRNWKQKLRLDGVMEIIKAKSLTEKDLHELLESAKLEGRKEASFDKLLSKISERD